MDTYGVEKLILDTGSMKHLKTYKLFESIERQTIKDIFLELEDIGFSVEIVDMFKIGKSESDPGLSSYGQFYRKDLNLDLNLKNKFKKDFICVKITKNSFEWDEVEDYIKRLIDFLENNSETYRYYQINFSNFYQSGSYPTSDLTDKFCDYIRNNHKKIEEIEIYFEII